MDPPTALLAGAALHAGSQAVVTVVVHPALAATPAHEWARVHAAHSRRARPGSVLTARRTAVSES
ncbi:hypothetical protein [Kineococcus arenarius]|uniref:hypothetical protein n=1 Tax=unclassified Kineococcus TaxID=2621656 RepID=UPI003D7D9435